MITGTLVFLALATFWAAALDYPDTRGFLKNWTLCVAAIMGLALFPDFRFDCGTFAHPISRHALIFAGSARGTPPEWVAPCG